MNKSNDPYVLHNLVFALKQQDRVREAFQFYERLVSMFPDIDTAFEDLDSIAFSDKSLFYLLFNAYQHLDEVRDKAEETKRRRAERSALVSQAALYRPPSRRPSSVRPAGALSKGVCRQMYIEDSHCMPCLSNRLQ